MTTETNRAIDTRIQVLVVVGVALVVAGVYSLVTLLYSIFGRYMYVEDLELGFDENTMFTTTRMTPVDKGIMIIDGVLVLLGAAALIAAIVRARIARTATLVRNN